MNPKFSSRQASSIVGSGLPDTVRQQWACTILSKLLFLVTLNVTKRNKSRLQCSDALAHAGDHPVHSLIGKTYPLNFCGGLVFASVRPAARQFRRPRKLILNYSSSFFTLDQGSPNVTSAWCSESGQRTYMYSIVGRHPRASLGNHRRMRNEA
jgi:hypothetical protein